MSETDIIVVGTGMYVCGRGTSGFGTVMPAILEYSRTNPVRSVHVIGRTVKGIKAAEKKIAQLKSFMGVKVLVKYYAQTSEKAKDFYEETILRIPKPACAIIAVPDNIHKEIAGYMISAGVHILVVKPLAATVKDAAELIRMQKQSGVYCAVEFHKRLDLANLKLRDIIREGAIGDPLYFVVEYSQRKSIPSRHFSKWVNFTNIFQYLGIHYVDMIYFATGAVPRRAMAIGQKGWLLSRGIDTYDAIQGIIEWEMLSGKIFSSHILTNWIDPEKTSAMSDQKIKVIGTEGRFESDQKKRGITIVTDDLGIEEPNPYFCSPYGIKGQVSYKGYGIDSIIQFLDDVGRIWDGCVTSEMLESERSTFRKSFVPTVILEGINKSLATGGRWINFKNLEKEMKAYGRNQ